MSSGLSVLAASFAGRAIAYFSGTLLLQLDEIVRRSRRSALASYFSID